MDFRLLGPLEVAGDDGPLALGGAKQRSLLAMLLLHANQVVSTDRLIDALWGASPPFTCGKSIQVYVSRLRKVVAGNRLVTHAPGYVLYVDSTELDLARFEQLVAEARRAAPEVASEKLHEALALWRGPPLADLAYEQFAQPEITRLEELRLAAVEQRLEADLALGRHPELIPELEALIVRNPLRERFRFQLMLALYRSERQAEALEAYRLARKELSDELGLEPSESLKRLEAAILRQDPELAPPAGREPVRAAPSAPPPERALLLAPTDPHSLDALLGLARPLAIAEPPRELIVASVVGADEVPAATARLALARDELLAKGLTARTAAFSSPAAGEDVSRLASQECVELVLMDAGDAPLDGTAAIVLERAPCDVALLVRAAAGGGGPVVVPFGAAGHDWAALELGAWLARGMGQPLRLVGAADRRRDGRDASRLLADASLIVQRTAGIVAEPVLTAPGRRGIAEAAEGAGALIVGLSERWREEGLGRTRSELASEPPAPTVFVRRGARPGGLAPAETRTRFSWSIAEAAA
ncbi:MAG TPA: AfsR/SARP family transcriptional regulator [Thermoleophilaceae bacterium]|jgi:DNA-binding SARP family transcriptional activator